MQEKIVRLTHRKHVVVFFIVTLLMPVFSLITEISAADVTAYIDLAAQPATAPSTISTQPDLAISTASDFYISYIPGTEFGSGDTVDIILPTSFTSLALCASSTTNSDGDATTDPDGALTLNSQTFTYTYTDVTDVASTTGVEFCFRATTPSSAGNYSISISDDNDDNVSAALVYVANENKVTISADVAVSLSLAIKDPSTTSDISSCALGTLNPGATNTCQYRIAAGTSHASGVDVYVIADDQLNTSTPTTDVDDIADDTLDAGTEEHGIIVGVGTGFAVQSNFHASNYEEINTIADTESSEQILTATAPVDSSNSATWSTITHGASVNTATTTGTYDQEVTYRAFAGT